MKDKKFFHYRNAFKSDHLASADVEELQENNEGVAILTLIKVEYFEKRMVAGRTKDKGLVAFFKEKDTKPMIVNAHNSAILKRFIGSANVHDWVTLNLPIELYVNHKVKMGSEVVGGIRIKTKQPKPKAISPTKPKATGKKEISPKGFTAALAAVEKGDYTVAQIIKAYILTDEQLNTLNAIK